MRTTFSFNDDKQLVQIALAYIDAGTRITWEDVARCMRSTGQSAVALRQRLQALFRTWGQDIARFPPSFFTEVRRPWGRPPVITQQLRSLAAHSSLGQSTTPLPSTLDASSLPEARSCSIAEAGMPPSDRCGTLGSSTETTKSSESDGKVTEPFTLRQAQPILSSSSAEEAVTAMFAKVPRAAVSYNGGSSHLNVGEVLPSGVTTLLRELGDIDGSDVFLDVGAGLGNVIAQVVLATKVSKAIGIEMRVDVYRLGAEMIARSPHGRHVYGRAEPYCKDTTDICFSRLPPYELATIVFWNNILFEPATIEFVKRELAAMLKARLFVCTASICP
ncbi:unnamed protein product [Phytophthora fragariaefolia]|uniref:Histone-lysine N-methyltransferase, H3 lysine-79 specific n=1 Tax=Phytophthora fragariaefolia TaxID=1490495 RepID=A0A9W7CRV9_9STRA|nr:unnamed protein product [Phytophthora fragariaefolia]